MTSHHIGTASDFADDEGRRVEVDGVEIAVFRIAGEYYGIQNRCPHKYAPLHVVGHDRFYSPELIADGLYDPDATDLKPQENVRGMVDHEGPAIYCPWHLLRWDLETGGNDEMHVSVATYDVEEREDGSVWVEL